MTSKTAVVIGVGPHEGLGAAVARQAARAGLDVFVALRILAQSARRSLGRKASMSAMSSSTAASAARS